MVKINLLKHQGLSFEGFKSWLNQLIADKKGALPDLNDWKLIKEKLEKVTVSKTIWVDYSNINLNRLYDESDSGEGEETNDDHEYTPWAGLDVSDDEWSEIDDMDLQFIEEINYLMDLNTAPTIDIRITYDQRKESEDDANGICEGI